LSFRGPKFRLCACVDCSHQLNGKKLDTENKATYPELHLDSRQSTEIVAYPISTEHSVNSMDK
jgi:hypothetical protein